MVLSVIEALSQHGLESYRYFSAGRRDHRKLAHMDVLYAPENHAGRCEDAGHEVMFTGMSCLISWTLETPFINRYRRSIHTYDYYAKRQIPIPTAPRIILH